MSCNCNINQNKTEQEKEQEQQPSPSLFAAFFGLRCYEPEPVVTETVNKCPECGEEICRCNFALKSHLKECCGLGQRPELFDCHKIDDGKKCKKAIKDCPASLESLAKSGSGKCQAKKLCPPRTEVGYKNYAPPPEEITIFGPVEEKKYEEQKCTFPETDISHCNPLYLHPPKEMTKTYPVPAGTSVSPISVGARAATLRATSESESEFKMVCEVLLVEDEQIRHHRDVFNPTLLIRVDGYMCPIFKVECAAAEECNCEDCVAERSGGCRRPDEVVEIQAFARKLREQNCDKKLPDFVTPEKVFADFSCSTYETKPLQVDEDEVSTYDYEVPLEAPQCPEGSVLAEEKDVVYVDYPYYENMEECPEGYYEESDGFYEYPSEKS